MADTTIVVKADRPCAGCGRFMISQRHWRDFYTRKEREEMRSEFTCHGVDSLCKPCWKREERSNQMLVRTA